MDDAEPIRVYYRLIASDTPSERDFWTHKRKGVPLRDPNDAEAWSRGVSVFELTAAARAMSKRIKNPPVPYMVKLVIPPTSTLMIEKTRGRAHYTIWDADPNVLLGYVDGPAELVSTEW